MPRRRIDPNRAFAGHDRHATRDEILSWLSDLVAELEYIPSQTFASGYADLDALPASSLRLVLPLVYERPHVDRVREVCGSWLEALIDSGVLTGDVQRTTRGTRLLANDGCLCLSLGERTIDDLLSAAGVAHEREVTYPGSRTRCDWKIGDLYVEYFGLSGDPAYDAKSRDKQALADRLGLRLLTILPQELSDPPALQARLVAAVDGAFRSGPVQPRRRERSREFTYIPRPERAMMREERDQQRSRLHLDRGARRRDAGVHYHDHRGRPHREAGPARIWDSGRVEWWRHGQLHRDDAPAKYGPDGFEQEWYRDGVRDRADGPADVEPKKNGGWFLEWHENGELVRRERRTSVERPLPANWYLAEPGPLD